MEDNKAQYSFLQLMNYMFKQEPYRYIATGQLEQIPQVTSESLYDTYLSMIQNDDCAIYVVGNINKEEVTQLILDKFAIKPFYLENRETTEIAPSFDQPQYIIEKTMLTKLN